MTRAPPFPLGFCTGSRTGTWHMRKQDSRWCPVYQACGCRIQTHLPVRWVLCRVSHVCMHHRVLEAKTKQFCSAAPSPLPLQTADIKGQEPRAMLIVRCQEMFAVTLSLKWLLQTWVSEKKKKKKFYLTSGCTKQCRPPKKEWWVIQWTPIKVITKLQVASREEQSGMTGWVQGRVPLLCCCCFDHLSRQRKMGDFEVCKQV